MVLRIGSRTESVFVQNWAQLNVTVMLNRYNLPTNSTDAALFGILALEQLPRSVEAVYHMMRRKNERKEMV